jgi:hypothetical protein
VLSSSFRITSARDSIFLGFILGLSVATKVTALPLMLLILLPKTWRDKVITAVVSLMAFFIVTIPSWPRLWRLANWLIAIATHDQHYGQGNVGLPSTEVLQDNFVALVNLDPGYFIFIILLVISILFFLLSSRKRTRSQLEKDFLKTLSMLAIILVAQTSITVKHPAAHYNIPSMALVGLIIFALFNTPRSLWKSPFQTRLFEYVLGATIIFSLSFGLINLLHHINVVQDHRDVILQMEEIRDADYKDCTLVNYYRSSSIPFALVFGSHWSGFVHSPFLTETYPEIIFYNIWGQNFYDYHNETVERSIINERLDQGECIIMQGSRFSDGREIYSTRLTLEDIVSTNNEEALYRLLAVDDS